MKAETEKVAEVLFKAMNQEAPKEHKAESLRPTKWIVNEVENTKQCEACGAIMRGWAYREKFDYCPKCGKRAEKAI